MLKSNLGIDVIGHVVVGLRVSFRPRRAYSPKGKQRIRSSRRIQWISVQDTIIYLIPRLSQGHLSMGLLRMARVGLIPWQSPALQV